MHGSGDSDDDAGPVASYPDVRRGTRCSLSGSCLRIAQRSWAFRRRSPADPAVRPALGTRCIPGATGNPGAHAVSPARLQRVETPSRPRRLVCGLERCTPPGTRRHPQDGLWKMGPRCVIVDGNKRKGATGFDGDHEARVACRAPGTRKSPETTTANQELALAA